MLQERYRKGVWAIKCPDRFTFDKLIKWIRKQEKFEKLWKNLPNRNARPIYHHVYRNTIHVDWRYREIDIGAHHNYKNVLEYDNVIEEEDLSENYNDGGQ